MREVYKTCLGGFEGAEQTTNLFAIVCEPCKDAAVLLMGSQKLHVLLRFLPGGAREEAKM